MNTELLRLEQITWIKQQKKILDVEELSIKKGEIIGVVGPNGAGKSTLIKIMSFLEAPTSGSLYFKGKKIIDKNIGIDLRRQIAVVFQRPLMLDTTVYHNVATSLKLRKESKKKIDEKVNDWLKQFGIEHLAKRHARTLSGGEAQRVALARALIVEPEILFLDEPFSSLDLPTRRKLLEDFKHILAKTKTTTLFVSHDFQEIQFLCSEMVILYQGKVVERTGFEDWKQKDFPKALLQFLQDWTTPLTAKG